jgi:hypothetical protein
MEIRRSADRGNTLRRAFGTSWFAQTDRRNAREGTSGSESPRDGPWMACFGGGLEALGPRPWNQDERAQAPATSRSSRPRIPQSSRLRSTVDERMQRTQRCVTASSSERASQARTPGAAADPASPQGRRESNPSKGRETPRADGAGRGKPGAHDPSADAAEGDETPGGAIRSVLDRGGRSGPHPERETKPEGAAVRSKVRRAGRTTEGLAVVKTTRRRRRTDSAATSDGALREARQPCEGRPRRGDASRQAGTKPRTPGGASTDSSDPTTGK